MHRADPCHRFAAGEREGDGGAVLDDPRFREDPVMLDELPELEIEITVLSPLEPADSPLDFELLEHGIYLHCEGETGCFLPGGPRDRMVERAASGPTQHGKDGAAGRRLAIPGSPLVPVHHHDHRS